MSLFRKILLSVAVLSLLSLVYLFINSVSSISPRKSIDQPIDYKQIINENNPDLVYKRSFTIKSSYPISFYTYEKANYGLIVFKKKANNEILDNISFIKRKKNRDHYKLYSIFMLEKLNIFFNKEEELSKMIFYIDKFKNEYIKEKKETSMYLSFPLNSTFAISFNNKAIDFQSSRIDGSNLEFNEMKVIVKEGFAYFIYLKPLEKNMGEKFILKELVLD